MARAGKSKGKVSVKDMKFRNDPMIRLYDKTQDWLQEKGRPLVIGVAVVIGVLILFSLGQAFFSYRESRAKNAFAQAFEKYNAPVFTTTATATTGKYYTDEKQKWQEAADAFERLAQDYSGDYGTMGLYYAGVSYLHIDRDKGLQLLQRAVDKNDQPTSDLARMALAENYANNGELDKAMPIYEGLLSSAFVPRQVVQLEMARAYEKSGDKQKATDLYFEAAKADRSAPASAEAEKRLAALAPEKVKELPPPDALPQ